MDPLDISSDSSDSGILTDDNNDVYFHLSPERENFRILRHWDTAAGPDSRSTVHGERARRPSSRNAFASNWSTSNSNNHSFMKLHSESGTSEGIRASNRPTAQGDESIYGLGIGNRGQHQTVNSRTANVYDRDYEKLSFEQVLRTLPPSLNRSSTNRKSKNPAEIVSSSQTRDMRVHLAGKSVTHANGYTRDYYGRGDYDDIVMNENIGGRTLSPSMMHGKSNSSTPFSASDPFNRLVAGEERVTGEDERLIYQAALEVLPLAVVSNSSFPIG